MKVLGLRNLTKFDLIEILFNLDTVSIHGDLDQQFLKPDEKTNPLLDLVSVKSIIDQYSKGIISEISRRKNTSVSFTRNFLFFLLISLLRERRSFRRSTAEFLVNLVNQRVNISTLSSQPLGVLFSFYGEGEVASKITDLRQLPRLTKQEAETLASFAEQSYNFTLIADFLGKSKKLAGLNETSFGFFLEANSVNSEFLTVLADKKAYQRNISNTSENIINLVINSNFKKAAPTELFSSFVEILGLLKSDVGTLWQVLVDEMVFEDENAAAKKAPSQGRRIFASTNVVVNSVLSCLSGLVDNIGERNLKFFFNSEGRFAALRGDLVDMLKKNEQLGSKSAEISDSFGGHFQASLKLEEFTQHWEQITKYEAFFSLETLETLHNKINPKVPQTENKAPVEEANKKAPVAAGPKKLQLGKGSLGLFTQYLSEFAETKTEGKIEEQFALFSSKYFSTSNKSLLQSIEELFSSKNEERRRPKIPKGTRDFTAFQMSIRRKVFQTITNIFARHGAVEIDTPVFELKETLTGKYGEDSKLIYDLDDQGGELLALRYDLTVPFARYVAMKNITNIKRYHIAKVYRRDNPVMSKGRFREFYQCDLDIAGNYDAMIPDAEVLKVIDEILTELEIGQFKIKVNNRKILDAMIEISKAPKQRFNQICSSIDKLDKEDWSEVRRELIEDKGLTAEMADCLGRFVVIKGSPREVLAELKLKNIFQGSKVGLDALEEMGLLFDYLEAMGGLHNVMFDLSLARGLDYYTGMICETVLEGAQVGSISGGGRYDGLVGMFTNKQIPSVGASIGIERIFGILEEKAKHDQSIRQNQTEVFIATVGPGMVVPKMILASELWKQDIKAEFLYNAKPKPQKQIDYVHEHLIPYMLWIGEDEVKANQVKLKYTPTHDEEVIKREDLVKVLKEKLAKHYKDLSEGKVKFEKKEEPVEEGAGEKRGAGKKEEKKPREPRGGQKKEEK